MNPRIFLEILNPRRQEVLDQLCKTFKNEYYLAGGTALALQIKHRKSVDFDLFKKNEITLSTKQKLFTGFKADVITTLVDTGDELTVVLNNEIKVTFLAYFWQPLFPLIQIPQGIPLLDIRDIALTKAYAIGRRANYRDYFDLYVILKRGHIDLKTIVQFCNKKYGELFSERNFLEQLLFLDDMSLNEPLESLGEPLVSNNMLLQFFKDKIQQYQKVRSNK